jgi:hypothetical protein
MEYGGQHLNRGENQVSTYPKQVGVLLPWLRRSCASANFRKSSMERALVRSIFGHLLSHQ